AGTSTVGVSSAAGMFVGEHLVVGTGDSQETVTLTGVDSAASTVTATFASSHPSGAPIGVRGGFAAGVIPVAMADGSSGTVLKIFGDINADGSMVYVEYLCD